MKKLDKNDKKAIIDASNKQGDFDAQKKIFELRKQVNELHFKFGISKSEIARKKNVSRGFVIRWTRKPNMDTTRDKRGWPAGKSRKWDTAAYDKVESLYHQLKSDPEEYFYGATAIQIAWRKHYPEDPCPPIRTLGRMLKKRNLSSSAKKESSRGAAQYLCYPEYSIYNVISTRTLEADFVGEKYIHGRTAPINFIGYAFKKAPKLRYFKRIHGKTSKEFKKHTADFIETYEKPTAIKVDNALAFIGSASGKRNISSTMEYLLGEEIIPIFSVPRKPFSQASIEGNNSVFSRKFWNCIEFNSVSEIDQKLEGFNTSSLNYTRYWKDRKKNRGSKKESERFQPYVYFIRQVREDENHEDGTINILNEKVRVPGDYITYFVLAQWDLAAEQLTVSIEKEQQLKPIEKISFKINSDYKI
ncbi:hypothetical protein GF366_02820 [Candidatus Peregrinibacteria bacterium]|nr:hypothetical protein [Candidatus Peregrinibacteria bacterium]